jgi:precorrin-6B methylase 2
MPAQTKDLKPEMVYYQKTPVRLVFELTGKCHFTQGDVFFDIGSGLGQVAILVNLLTGVKATGIEFEPAFCNYARDCAAELNLPGVTFSNTDARTANYSDGTVFFLYTPFTGEMLQEVLELLRTESIRRKIRVIIYGPCTPQVALQNWLRSDSSNDNNIHRLAFFSSI